MKLEKRSSLLWIVVGALLAAAAAGIVAVSGDKQPAWESVNREVEELLAQEAHSGEQGAAKGEANKSGGGAASPEQKQSAQRQAQGNSVQPNEAPAPEGTSKPRANSAPPASPPTSPPAAPPAEASPGENQTNEPQNGSKQEAAAPASSAPREGLVAINQATAAELDRLPGIGAAKAKAIVDYRDQHGLFRKKEDLLKVKGIGPKLLQQIQNHIFIETNP
ncbi:ComEA family DNA-binding protein [Paenibacillus turpanensis]|uniref:ComEA family DNA-binding protein n=1 Tax=Paenibacillus turpanensis TaxID=2689078 RepID=UPI00140B608A|nr:helix-hairpin-helix domain-containing protein [Paenibacillus turpanensis]